METSDISSSEKAVGERVREQYRRAPFPPVGFFPIVAGPPKQRIWLYSFVEAYYHAFRVLRTPAQARLLDAGCGTGHGVHQIRHQAPGAVVHACDFSAQSLGFAQQRIAALNEGPVTFHEANLLELGGLPGDFDVIFCSGVVHHTANPVRTLQQLKSKLKPDGVMYLMLYSKFGRRPTMLMQRALQLLCENPTDQAEGLRWGKALFDGLPADNPIATWERVKWGNNHRRHDEAFIDMYVNANEKNYSVSEVCADLATAGLRLVRFANPHEWELANRMQTIAPALRQRFEALPEMRRWEVIEHLFPVHDQYLFFATHAENTAPLPEWATQGSLVGWEDRLTAIRSPFAQPIAGVAERPGHVLWCGYFERPSWLEHGVIDLLTRCAGARSLREIARDWESDIPARQGRGVELIRQLEVGGFVYLTGRQ